MFEESYLAEVNIECATQYKEELWNKVLKLDLKKSLAGFAEMLSIERCNNAIKYWGIMLQCHGGN